MYIVRNHHSNNSNSNSNRQWLGTRIQGYTQKYSYPLEVQFK